MSRHWMALLSLAMTAILLFPFGVEARPSYRKVLRQHSRHDRVYEIKNFEPEIIWHATRLTPEMVEAQVDRLARTLHFNEGEKEAELKSRLSLLEKGEAFFVSFFTIDRSSNNLTRAEAPWRFEMSAADGEWQRPNAIDRVRHGRFEQFLYPYVDRWSECYLVTFPKRAPSDGPVKLRLLGLGESSTLSFR